MGVGSTAAASSTALASEGGLERWSSTKVVRTLALARTAAGTTAATIAAATEALVLARSPEVSSGTAEVSPETIAIAGLPQPLGLLLQMHHAAHAFVLHALAFTPSAQRSSRLMLRSFGTHLNGVVAVDALGGAASSAEALLNAAVAFVAIVLEEMFGSKGGSSAGGGKAGSCTGTAVPFRAGEGGDGDGDFPFNLGLPSPSPACSTVTRARMQSMPPVNLRTSQLLRVQQRQAHDIPLVLSLRPSAWTTRCQ
jgi:hypothetical protein